MLSFRVRAGLIAALLLAGFLAVAYLYQKQHGVLDTLARGRAGYLDWYAFQLEKESLRLQHEIDRVLVTQPPFTQPPETLKLRYGVFVSRVRLLQDTQGLDTELSGMNPSLDAPVSARLEAFIRAADPVIDDPDVLNLERLQALQEELTAMAPELADMVQSVHHKVYALADDTTRRVDVLTRVGAALTATLLALMCLLAVLALRHYRQLDVRRQLEAMAQDLLLARKNADAANRAKSAFVANVSHELRTPFQGLLGMMSLLGETRLNAEQSDYLRTGMDTARHLMQLLNDVLDISKIESGRLMVQPVPVSLKRLFAEVDAVMRPLAQERRLPLVVRLPADLPEWALADAMRVKQILFNLLGNALKFTVKGRVQISVSWLPALEGKQGRLSVDVMDTGTGIPASELPRLFTRFHQHAESQDGGGLGHGLGLEISRSLARLMGGDISAHSVLGKGSTFTLSLNLVPCGPPASRALAPDAEMQFPGLRALVAEDHAVNRKYMAAVLARMGVHAVLCENGANAVREAARGSFDIVFLDVHMPVMGGLDAARRIRAKAGRQPVPRIVALTADNSEATQASVRDAGIDELIHKPATREALAALLASLPQRPAGPQAWPDSTSAAEAWTDSNEVRDAAHAGVVDLPALQDLAKNFTPTQYLELADTLFRDESNVLAQLRQAVAAGNALAAHRHAHSLKGAAEVLALAALADAAQAITESAQDTQGIGLAHLEHTLDTAQAVVHAMLAEVAE